MTDHVKQYGSSEAKLDNSVSNDLQNISAKAMRSEVSVMVRDSGGKYKDKNGNPNDWVIVMGERKVTSTSQW